MSAPKLSVYRGLLAKAETAYADAAAVSNTADGILVVSDMVPAFEYVGTGERRPNNAPGMAGNMRKVAPAGRGVSYNAEHEMKGAAAAYSASAFPSGHRLILASGFDGAVTTTGGSEKWDYTPTPKGTAPTSLSTELYGRETKYPVSGVYADFRVEAEAGQIPLWTFAMKGIGGTIADAQIPAITYPTLTTEPPRFVSASFTLGSFTTNAVVRSFSFALNRAVGLRKNGNNTGHSGFSPGRRNPTLEVLIEATDLVGSPYHTSAGLDPYLLFDNATEMDFSITIGATQYNRWKLIPGKVQLMAPVQEEDDEGAALWRLQLQCNPTTANANDDVTIRFD